MGLVAVASLVFSGLFSYVSGSPFILQEIFGLSPSMFGIAFAANAVGMIAMTQLNPVLVRRWGPARILRIGVGISLLATTTLMLTSLFEIGGLAGFLVPLWVAMAGFGLSMPNSPALALSRHGEAAGTAAAVLGAAQFGIGGLVSPLVGVLSNGTAVPMAAIMATATLIASIILFVLRKALRGSADRLRRSPSGEPHHERTPSVMSNGPVRRSRLAAFCVCTERTTARWTRCPPGWVVRQ